MHRSGTSAFTGLLSLLGLDLGPSLLAASSANEAGYWEHGPVVTVHERLLLALGSRWDDVCRLPERWWESDAVTPFRAELREILTRDFAGTALWAVKDPRTCRLLPLWIPLLEELECQPLWVLMTRHPAENIGSLEKRNLFSHEKSELLWLQHTVEAERNTRGRNRVVLTFDQLMEDWASTVRRVQQALGMPWPVPPERAAAQVGQFVDPGKRHHRAADTAGLSAWTRETYESLLFGSMGDDARMRAGLDLVSRAYDTAGALYGPVIRNRDSEVEMQMADVSNNYANLFDAFRELQERYRETKEKLTAKSEELKARKEQLRQFERSPGGRLARFLNRFKSRKPKSAKSEDAGDSFPKAEEPVDVSIIISGGRDQNKLTRCLNSVRQQGGGLAYEVLAVVDDNTGRALRRWRNLQVCPIGKARSFGEAHNRAAQKARGKVLVFLQDDMNATPGWLEALLEPLGKEADAGAVGTEGGVLARNGTFEIREETEQLREADFCTTACLAVTKNLFFQIGGFDGYYRPVEEANFGLKIHQTKRKTLQQPLCRPARQSPRSPHDPKRMESNRSRFMRRWQETLANRG